MCTNVGARAREAHDEVGTRMHRRQRADLHRVEDAEDVELPLLREIGSVGEERECDTHTE